MSNEFTFLPRENRHGAETAGASAFEQVFSAPARVAPPRARLDGDAGAERQRRGRTPTFFIPGSQRRVTQYQREKASGIRRQNGAAKLKKLTPRHLVMINMHLAGLSMEEIAEQMKVTLGTVWRVVTDPLAKVLIANVYETRKQEIDSMLGMSTQAVREVLRTGSAKERMQAVSVYSKLKQTIASDTNPAQTAEDVAAQIVANAKNIQINYYQNGE